MLFGSYLDERMLERGPLKKVAIFTTNVYFSTLQGLCTLTRDFDVVVVFSILEICVASEGYMCTYAKPS